MQTGLLKKESHGRTHYIDKDSTFQFLVFDNYTYLFEKKSQIMFIKMKKGV